MAIATAASIEIVPPPLPEVDDAEHPWAEQALNAWLDAARAADVNVVPYARVEVLPDGSLGWVVIDERLWLVQHTNPPQEPLVYATRPGAICRRVRALARGRYELLPEHGLEEWRAVQLQAEDEGAKIIGEDTLSGHFPFTTVQRITHPGGDVTHWFLDPLGPPRARRP